MNENDLDLNLDNLEVQAEEKVKIKDRYQKLSEGYYKEKSEKEKIAQEKAEADRKATELAKERDFYKGFSENVTKYPEASAYQDRILEKVRGGYTTEDAIYAVLAKEGKLGTTPAPQAQINNVEGGSTPNNFEGTKSIGDMSASEKLEALAELDKKGELIGAFRRN